MRNKKLIVTGIVMLTFGALLVFHGVASLPLWLNWVLGPLFWYGGFVVAGTGLLMRAFSLVVEEQAETAPVRKKAERVIVHHFVRLNAGPKGVLHEIPAMGGFIL